MSPINLLILGVLIEKSMNAYELNKFIQNSHINKMIKVSVPAVYKNMLKLNSQGYVAKAVKSENETEKTVYFITQEGREHFKRLMYKFVNNDVKFHFDFNSFIINIHHIPKKDGLLMLEALKKQFYSRKEALEYERELYSPVLSPTLSTIYKQQYMITQTMISWVEAFIEEYGVSG